MNEITTQPTLSVVVIVYNNELYVEEALESLHAQTLKEIEVVVVNDHSTDRSAELIDAYVADKPNFKAIHLEENSGGCSVPRNTGIANSTGKYVMFLDGDDWYTVDGCEKMVAAIERTGSDFVGGQVIRTNNYEIWYHKQIYAQERINTNIREFSTLFFDSLSVNKIYQRAFLDKHALRFPEGIHYEDIVFTGKAYFLAEAISFIPEPVYYWRVVEDADVKSITNRRHEFENFSNRIVAHRLFDQFLREHGDTLYQSHKNNKFLRHDLKLYVNDYAEFDEEYREQFHELIRAYMHEVMDEYSFVNLHERERILYYLLYHGDRAAFEDYIKYLDGEETSENRVYAIGPDYYFRPSFERRNQLRFLKISKLEADISIYDMLLENDVFSFSADVSLASIPSEEVHLEWGIKNRTTGHQLVTKDKDRILFLLRDMEPGNYYLSLYIRHQGNVHRHLVKKEHLQQLRNVSVENERFEKRLYINHKNSFAVKVIPKKNRERVKTFIQKRVPESGFLPDAAVKKHSVNLFQKLPLKPKWVLFESHMGKQYSDSPRAIYEEMVRTKKGYTYIWVFENPEDHDVPGSAIKVKRHSVQHFYYMMRSKYWVDNQGMAHLVPKRKGQVYVQTWHGTPLKRMGYDQKNRPSAFALSKLQKQVSAWDYFVSPNAYSTQIFKRAFRYSGEILETGYPRNDMLLKNADELGQSVRKQLKITQDKKVVLFAPTFRDWDVNSYQRTVEDLHELSRNVDEDTVILLRLHYLLSSQIGQRDLPDNTVDVSTYLDIADLYAASDILITDYSSVMFDFALLNRPVILYTYDLEEYAFRRGMYFDLASGGPGPVCRQVADVVRLINHPEQLMDYHEQLERFIERFGSLEDGTASSRVIQQVFK